MKILILGATGMLGNALFTELSRKKELAVFGTVRYKGEAQYLPEKLRKNLIFNIDIENTNSLVELFSLVKPDVVVNCVGLIKQLAKPSDTALYVSMNALFPHRIAALAKSFNSRLVHYSTDCVFSGKSGNYKETDFADAEDIYGRSKFLGEVSYDHTLTIRTSIIGHGLETHVSLIDWFLGQKDKIKGYEKVIYSGLPTVEHARILGSFVIPNKKLKGLYHVSAKPISKYELLKLVSKIYRKKIDITADDKEVSDRSLNSERFTKATGYKAPDWETLISRMYKYWQSNDKFIKF